MKLSTIQIISLKVMLLFIVAIFSTFVGDCLHTFFGDWKCEGSGKLVNVTQHDYGNFTKCNYTGNRYHDAQWHWGYRHWLYLVMCIILFIIQVVDIINFADNADKKK